MAIIQIQDVSKKFQTKDGEIDALKHVTLDIEAGDIYGIIGMSGAGKSTLVRCINHIEVPTEGTVIVQDKDLSKLSEKELRKQREHIGMIFQHFNLLMQKSVLENVCFPLFIQEKSKAEAKKKAYELLDIVGLKDRAKAYPSQLSGGKEGLKPNKVIYKILDVIANIVRSIPFLILLILLIPFTRLLLGKSYGSTATIVPLTAAAIPFIARMVESSLKEVDYGVIEAAKAMGASNSRIIFKVLLVEARTSLITGATIAIGTILGYSAMAGAVGGGGLGDIAVRYGYYRYQTDIMLVTVALLIVIVQVFQSVGMFVANRLDRRK